MTIVNTIFQLKNLSLKYTYLRFRFFLSTMAIAFLQPVCYAQATTGQSHQQKSIENNMLHFSPFEGTVYLIPKKGNSYYVENYYSDKVLDYEVLHTSITLEDLQIPEVNYKEFSFPGVERTTRFGMILYSQLSVAEAGCYEFSLNSDDGSILWIDGQEIVNNDGSHQMTMTKDSFALQPGQYEAKVWYFQGLPTRFGFEFDHAYVGPPEDCEQTITGMKPEPLILDALHFESDRAVLTTEGLSYIETIGIELAKNKPKEITIIGHTDDVGTDTYNLELSQRRAISVMRALRDVIPDNSVKYLMIGRGSTQPIDDTDSDEGRARNRRVEIVYK